MEDERDSSHDSPLDYSASARYSIYSPIRPGSLGHRGQSASPVVQRFYEMSRSPLACSPNRLSYINDSSSMHSLYSVSPFRRPGLTPQLEGKAPSDYPEDSREERLRALWQDAQLHHMTQAAIYFAEKLMTITDDVNDVYMLAEAYYESRQYERALDLLNKKNTLNRSVPCRYLAGLCAIALCNWSDALDYLGHQNPFTSKDVRADWNSDGRFRLEAAMCYARGNAYLQLREVEKAKQCFKEALQLDVRCYDALDALIKNNMLQEKAEWEFIMTLPYDEHCGEDSDLFRSLYMLDLKKYSHISDISDAQRKAGKEHSLQGSLDVLRSIAETLLAQNNFKECLKICEQIRHQDALYTKSIPAYLTCLYELKLKNELYEFAQELVDRLNAEAVTWHAVGLYYLYIQRYPEARRYFSQATSMDQYFEAAWLGYGHASSAEKDHDQAINAYLSCSKLIPGSHIPYMYIGVEYMEQDNMDLAYEYLIKGLGKCMSDPYLMNELGTYHYRKNEYPEALNYFRKAVKLAKDCQNPGSSLWPILWTNLGHVYRKLRDYGRALRSFKLARDINPRDPHIRVAMGMIYHLRGEYHEAVVEYNKAATLGHGKTGNRVSELMDKAIASIASLPFVATQGLLDAEYVLKVGDKEEELPNFIEQEISALKSEGKHNNEDDAVVRAPLASLSIEDEPVLMGESDLLPPTGELHPPAKRPSPWL